MTETLPLPPFEMRELVGPTDPKFFDNPYGRLVFPDIPIDKQTSVFDFGCGCGRVARQLMQQNPPPQKYVGIDLHQGMIKWCQDHLQKHAKDFQFMHHDVLNLGFNPKGKPHPLPFQVGDHAFELVVSWSVFTHVLEEQVLFYLKEITRILAKDGIFLSTWFTFDKQEYPMMQTFQNALYINTTDPTNAVIFDRSWLKSATKEAGLKMVKIVAPAVRGYQWIIQMTHTDNPLPEVDFPADAAPAGVVRPPVAQTDPSRIGL